MSPGSPQLIGGSAGVAEGVADAVFGEEGVEDVVERGPVVVGEFVEAVEAVAEVGVGGAEGAAGGVVDEEVVAGDVEGFGQFDDDVGAGGHLGGFVAADLAGVGAELGGEVGLGPAVFGAEGADSFAEGHVVGSGVLVVPRPLCGHRALPCVRVRATILAL